MPDLSEIKVDLKTVVAIVMTVVTGLGVYYGLKAKLDAQTATVTELHAEVAALKGEQEQAKRAILELTITLKAKGIITQ
jgi:uncharacterized protein HemX